MRTILIYSLLVLVVAGIIAFLAIPIILGKWEVFYIHLFLTLFLIQTTGILRLYNAVFHNTRFLIKTQKKLQSILVEVPILRRVISNEVTTEKQNTTALRDLLKQSQEECAKIDLLKTEMEKWRKTNGNIK